MILNAGQVDIRLGILSVLLIDLVGSVLLQTLVHSRQFFIAGWLVKETTEAAAGQTSQ